VRQFDRRAQQTTHTHVEEAAFLAQLTDQRALGRLVDLDSSARELVVAVPRPKQ
jgi:hypothetical protein